MNDCLSDSLIAAYCAQQLDDARRATAEAHLRSCPQCAARVSAAREEEELLGHLRDALADRVALSGPDPDAPTVAAAAGGERRPRPPASDELTRSASGRQPRGARPAVDIPGYEILGEIHRGGQGVVLRAVQKSTKQEVAIKLLLDGAFASHAAKARFEREIELVARLKHPNIVTVFDSGITADGRRFCVMDYIRGRTLREHVRQTRPPLAELLALFGTICDAVAHAHQNGVIHRDLKPSNILVDADGRPRVLDFGLAKPLAAEADPVRSLTGEIIGTLPYLAPEQARGEPDRIDVRTDVYALGVILYELLTGEYPYPVAGHFAEALRNIAEAQPTPPAQRWKSGTGQSPVAARGRSRTTSTSRRSGRCPIDHDVETIVLKALSKEPERRYQSVGELARDVRHYLAGEAIDAKRDSALYVLRKLLQRNMAATIVTACVIVVLLSTTSISLGFYVDSLHARQRQEGSEQQVLRLSQDQRRHAESLPPAMREGALGWFLLEWHAGRAARARQIAAHLRPEDAEHKAMSLLLADEVSLDQALTGLRPEDSAVMHFVAGERELKQGRPASARRLFEASLAIRSSGWVADAARARVDELRKSARAEP